jgi:signal transduction histidine kinase
VILSNVEALELYTGQTKWSGNIKKQSQHLAELTHNLLSLSRMDENAVLNVEDVQLNNILQMTLDAFQSEIQKKGLNLLSEIDEDVRVRVNRGQMENLFTILMDNAVSYTDENGTLQVRLHAKKQHFILQIENTCHELPDVPPEKLFERFYRADRSHRQNGGKCGIGLSIAETIVSAHKGTIKVSYHDKNRLSVTVKI